MELLGIPSRKITVLPIGLPPHFHDRYPEIQVQETRIKYGLTSPYFLYLGGYDARKNVPFLLRVFEKFQAASNKPVNHLVLGGVPDSEIPTLKNQTEALGISGKVRLLGYIEDQDLPLIYLGGQAFLYPTLYEGFGLPVLEAMACGTPVVCSNLPALKELAGKAALMPPPGDWEGWVEALRKLSNHPHLGRELADQGKDRARGFSWETAAKHTWALYEEVLVGMRGGS
jgi:glycosyltransferase involved in cell wall biosynthesis